MTTEQHVVLYNIGMRLTCGGITGDWHLCPNKRNYKYFVYWDKVSEQGCGFGRTVGQNKIQIRRQTGEEIVFLEEKPCICKRFTAEERVEMVYPSPHKKKECARTVEELKGMIAKSVKNTAIEKTLVLKENDAGWQMPMADFVDVFDAEALFAHFKSLFRCFLEEIILGNSGRDVLARMTDLLKNWEQIFDGRESVLRQVFTYIRLSAEGIEKTGRQPDDFKLLLDQARIDLDQKKKAEDCLSFLLPEDIYRERFQECVTVLTAFLKAYAKDESKDLLPYIQKYENKNIQINKIRRLGKADMSLPQAKKANANLIKEYLADGIKYNLGVMFECVA